MALLDIPILTPIESALESLVSPLIPSPLLPTKIICGIHLAQCSTTAAAASSDMSTSTAPHSPVYTTSPSSPSSTTVRPPYSMPSNSTPAVTTTTPFTSTLTSTNSLNTSVTPCTSTSLDWLPSTGDRWYATSNTPYTAIEPNVFPSGSTSPAYDTLPSSHLPSGKKDDGNHDHPSGPYTPSQRPGPQQLSTGATLGITFGILAALLFICLAIFILLRRARRRVRRTSIDSARWHLRPHSYDPDDSSSFVISSVWTWTGSMSADSQSGSRHEPSIHSLDFKFGDPEKAASTPDTEFYALSPCPSPSPSSDLLCTETQPLTQGTSSLPQSQTHLNSHPNPHQDIHHLVVSTSPAAALRASPPSELLALAGTDFTGARLLGGHSGELGRSVSGVSHVTASSRYVQSVEAL